MWSYLCSDIHIFRFLPYLISSTACSQSSICPFSYLCSPSLFHLFYAHIVILWCVLWSPSILRDNQAGREERMEVTGGKRCKVFTRRSQGARRESEGKSSSPRIEAPAYIRTRTQTHTPTFIHTCV
jgi:hypothetical protein